MSKKKRAAFLISILFLSLVVCISAACAQDLEIGAIIPLTGSSAQYGKWQQQGIELAREEIAATKGPAIRVNYQDSLSDPKTAIAAYKFLANGKSLCVITGVSGVVLALAPLASETGLPQVNTSGQNPKIADTDRYTISLINLADVETAAMASYAYRVLGLRKIAAIHSNQAAGTGATDQFKVSFERLGGTITARESYDDQKTDYRAQVIAAFSSKPEAVFAPGVSMNISRVMKQAYELGEKTQWLSYTGFEGPEVVNIAGDAANGTIYTSTALDLLRHPKFLEHYKAKYGSDPELYAATAYDAIFVLSEAYQRGGKSRADLTSVLTSGKFEYEGVTGKFTINEKGLVTKPVLLKMFENGRFLPAKRQLD